MSTLDSKSYEIVGGKAAVLLELQRAEFAVPEFVVSPVDLKEAVIRLGFPLAVRSSATLEDGHMDSFAGQFDSFLNLSSLEEVESAVQKCRDSLKSVTVVRYCRRKGIDASALRMDVILQRMLQPELAGVAFTINPMTGSEEIVVEACCGLADQLLAGRASALSHKHPLMQRYLPAIRTTARKSNVILARPQDIEFAVQNGTVFVLQSRPITSTRFRSRHRRMDECRFPRWWSVKRSMHATHVVFVPVHLGPLVEVMPSGGPSVERGFRCRTNVLWASLLELGSRQKMPGQGPGLRRTSFRCRFERTSHVRRGWRPNTNNIASRHSVPSRCFSPCGVFCENSPRRLGSCWQKESEPIEHRYEPIPRDINSVFRELIEQDYYKVETAYFRTIFAVSLAKMDFLVVLSPLRLLATDSGITSSRTHGATPRSETDGGRPGIEIRH